MSGPQDIFGIGVAGNFTGHLEQAGEAADFAHVVTRDAKAPKGIFPWYLPGDGTSFLHTWPLSSDALRLPDDPTYRVQTEPEVGLRCELSYDGDRVTRVHPVEMAAWNDASIRQPPAPKISLKKNWGANTKGCAARTIAIDGLAAGGLADRFRLASFLVTEDSLLDYGEDSALVGYSYFHQTLLDWLADRLSFQEDGGPLENMSQLLAAHGHPSQCWVSIGATRYTEQGDRRMLARGEQSVVVVYDAELHSAASIRDRARSGDDVAEGMSLLRQTVT